MQSRLGGIAKRSSFSYWVRVLIYYSNQAEALRGARGLASASTAGRTADPALHAGDFDSDPALDTAEPHEGTKNVEPEKGEHNGKGKGTEPLEAPSIGTKPPYPPGSSPRLESRSVPLNPTINQQKRSCSHGTGARILEEVSCAGLDGSPWPRNKEEEQKDRKEQQEDEQEYYKHHKASPLAEIEFADTRKPITRATDGTADAGAARDVIGWRPEQLDTAEEALERATRIWKHNAIHGDPDAPHSRVLRALREGQAKEKKTTV